MHRYRLTIKDDAVAVTARNGLSHPSPEDGAESVYTYDRAGRLFAAWVGQRFYRRGLDGRVVEKHSVRERGVRIVLRRTLETREADAFLNRAAACAADAQAALSHGEAEVLWSASGRESVADALRLAGTAAAYNADAARQDAQRYATVYRPVGILPPDQYLALVVQVTEGCHWNRCSFCTFYREVPFHLKSIAELEAHLHGVIAYLGEGATLRHSLFLGEANALCLPTEDLVLRLELIRRWFSPNGQGGRSLYSFMDVFTGRRKSAAEFTELRAHGLRRVYVGLESGDDVLLRFLNKPQRADHATDLVRTLKAAGLSVGVIVMAGVGGARFADSHTAHTLDLLNALPLDANDLIYLSAFTERPYSDYERAARAEGIRPLDPPEIHAQMHRLRAGLQFGTGGPRIARYDIEEFIY